MPGGMIALGRTTGGRPMFIWGMFGLALVLGSAGLFWPSRRGRRRAVFLLMALSFLGYSAFGAQARAIWHLTPSGPDYEHGIAAAFRLVYSFVALQTAITLAIGACYFLRAEDRITPEHRPRDVDGSRASVG
jgi:hypothetical protein